MSTTDPFEQLRGILGELREEHGGESAFEEQLRAARRGTTAGKLAARRRKIAALAARGATAGEREAAEAALSRFDHPTHAEQDRMQRGGNFREE